MEFIFILGILLVLGLISTRLMKVLNLPNVTGYLIIGLLAAFVCLLIDKINGNNAITNSLSSLNYNVSGVALGFIALSIGEEFKISKIKGFGSKIISITFLQAFLAMILVDIVVLVICYLLKARKEFVAIKRRSCYNLYGLVGHRGGLRTCGGALIHSRRQKILRLRLRLRSE